MNELVSSPREERAQIAFSRPSSHQTLDSGTYLPSMTSLN